MTNRFREILDLVCKRCFGKYLVLKLLEVDCQVLKFLNSKTIFSFDWAEVPLLIKIKHSYLLNAEHIQGTVLNAKENTIESTLRHLDWIIELSNIIVINFLCLLNQDQLKLSKVKNSTGISQAFSNYMKLVYRYCKCRACV